MKNKKNSVSFFVPTEKNDHTAACSQPLEMRYAVINPSISLIKTLIGKHYPYLKIQMYKRAFSRLRNHNATEEIVQHAFVKAMERDLHREWQPSGEDGLNDLSAYLCRIIETLFLDDRRKKIRQQTESTYIFQPEWMIGYQSSIEIHYEYMKKKLSGQAFKIMQLLSEGYSQKEIAKQMAIPIDRVRKQIYRSRSVLKHDG